jgi:hypothetical protein
MTIFVGDKQIKCRHIGGIQINKVMLGLVEIFPNIISAQTWSPSDFFASDAEGVFLDMFMPLPMATHHYNRVNYSNQLDNVVWDNPDIVPRTKTAGSHPTGLSQSWLVTPVTGKAPRINLTAAMPGSYGSFNQMFQIFSFYFDPMEQTEVSITMVGPSVSYNIASDVVKINQNSVDIKYARVVDAGNGWKRFVMCCQKNNVYWSFSLSAKDLDKPIKVAGLQVEYLYNYKQLDAKPYQDVPTVYPADWFDLYPDSTMRTSVVQDAPVTLPMQPVGFVIDQHDKARGPDIAVTSWGGQSANFTTFIPNGNSVTLVATGYAGCASLPVFPTLVGETYEVDVTFQRVSGSISVYVGNSANTISNKPTLTMSGRSKLYLTMTGGGNLSVCFEAPAAMSGTITIHGIKKVDTNNVSQATAAARPAVQSVRNSLSPSRVIAVDPNWSVTGTTLTRSTNENPFSWEKSYILTATAVEGEHRLTRGAYVRVAVPMYNTASVYARKGTGRYAVLTFARSVNTWASIFDLETGTMTYAGDGTYGEGVSITDVGDGWWRIAHKTTSDSANLCLFTLGIANGPTSAGVSFTGAGETIEFCCPMVNAGEEPLAYQATDAQMVYDPTVFPAMPYYDGVDDKLVNTYMKQFPEFTLLAVWLNTRGYPGGMSVFSTYNSNKGFVGQANTNYKIQSGIGTGTGVVTHASTDLMPNNRMAMTRHSWASGVSKLSKNAGAVQTLSVPTYTPKDSGGFTMGVSEHDVNTDMQGYVPYILLINRDMTEEEITKFYNWAQQNLGDLLP